MLLHNHRLRGNVSTVLTATAQVNGRWQILTPYRIIGSAVAHCALHCVIILPFWLETA